MKNKIIFLSYLPLVEKFYSEFFIDNLIKNEFDVEYWDLTPIYWPDLEIVDKITSTIVIEFNSLKDFKRSLKTENTKRTVFIPYMGYNYIVLKLFRLLTRYNSTIAFFNIGLFPTMPPVEKITKRFLQNPTGFFTIKRIKLFINGQKIKISTYLHKRLNLIKEYDFVFAAGEAALNSFKNKEQVIAINLSDYDYYLSLKKKDSKLLNYNYCVFHDEDFVSHPDIKMLGWKNINPTTYYFLLNNFFELIEQQYEIKVVISAHPKSNYKKNPFNERPLYRGLTNELVKFSEFSICVASTSISYPILYNKPIIFFSTNDIASCHGTYNKKPQHYAKYLGCNYYRIDDIKEESEIVISPISEKKYNKYKYNYLTSKESENKMTKDIVIDFLKDFFAKRN